MGSLHVQETGPAVAGSARLVPMPLSQQLCNYDTLMLKGVYNAVSQSCRTELGNVPVLQECVFP